MKRLRKHLEPQKVRFFQCGEYGENLHRPHHHAILFGYKFPDLVAIDKNQHGDLIYTSALCNKIWGKGTTYHGEVTRQSAQYVAQYIMKKRTGDEAQSHYARIHPETGEIFYLQPEYITMSRRPAIGAGWIDKYTDDTYKDDFIVHDGRKYLPPKFYDKQLEKYDAELYQIVKVNRKRNALLTKDDNSPARRKVKEKIAEIRASQKPRN